MKSRKKHDLHLYVLLFKKTAHIRRPPTRVIEVGVRSLLCGEATKGEFLNSERAVAIRWASRPRDFG